MSKLWIILVGVAFLFGIPVGYYLYPQAPVDTIPSLVFQYAPLVGTGILIFKTIKEYFRENVFDYGGIYKKLDFREGVNETGFYLRIIKKRGPGRLEKCEGSLTMHEPDGSKLNIPTTWYGTDYSRYRDVSVQDDLKLFNLSEDGERMFVFSHYEDNPSPNPSKYYERLTDRALNSIISVTLGVSSGTVPKKPFVMKIGDIINNAKNESPKMTNLM